LTPAKSSLKHGGILEGLRICFSDYGDHGKDKLQVLAQELGAAVSMSANRVDFILGADTNDSYFNTMAATGRHDIVHIDWMLQCA